MMSEYDGFERPYPSWFPKAVIGAIIAGGIVYQFVKYL
jgi:hypothetical protein